MITREGKKNLMMMSLRPYFLLMWQKDNTVTHRIPNRGRYLDSILCQSRPFEYRTIRKPDKNVRLLA
jgi:hypothetical protein